MEYESMTPKYFISIYNQLIEMKYTSWVDKGRIQLLLMDVGILKAFCLCLETWNYSVDEESMERWRSVITPFKVIWPNDLTLLSLPLKGMSIQDFNSVMFELEAKVVQSKQHFEGWYRNSIMQCKCLDVWDISRFIREIGDNLLIFSAYRAGENIVPLKKQCSDDILITKLKFLETILIIVLDCPDDMEILQFLNSVGNFVNSIACLKCLYWAKEDNHEIACEMNMVLFDMLQKLVPYACIITPLYIDFFLKSDDLQLVSDSFLLADEVGSFVDFLFEHLAIVLKDDFLILRDRLMFLITFLTNPRCENAEEEGDSIRSQIYAILNQDVYLLLSFDEMKEDYLSDKKTLLSGCMTRIDIANAKIRQLNCRSSASWITLEVEEMEYKYIVSIHRELSSLDKCGQGAVIEKMQLYKMELRSLRVFLLWLATWDDTDEETKVKLSSIIVSFRGIWDVKEEEEEEERLLSQRLHALRRGSITDWHPLAFELQGKIHRSKLETGAWCVNLFQSTFQFKASTGNKTMEFLDSILEIVNDLVGYKASEALEDKLMFLKDFLKLAMNCTCYEELEEFKMCVQAFANDAACLTFIYWAKDANAESSAYETNCILSHMLRKIKPATPDVARLYFGTLMAIYVQQSDSHMFGRTAFSFVQLLLEDLVTHLKDDDFHILQDNIVFLLTFLNDPPDQNADEFICSLIDVLFWEGLYSLTPFDDIEGGFSKKKVLLSDFMMKIEAINANIRCIYGNFPDSSQYNFPKVISPQFLNFLLQNLRNLKDRMDSDRKYVPFAKYKIIKIEEELTSLGPFFNHIFDLQSELKETWLQVVSVLHLTEHVIMSCISSLFVFDHPFWYHMAYLSNVFDEIKVVKAKLEMIKLDNTINNARCLPSSVGFISELEEQGKPSEINEIVVGLEDEEEKIIGMLTRGSKSLDVVSIVGMGGLGKTTLAKKIFSSSLVKRHFHVFAFCSVSLDHDTRRLLLDIIRDIKGDDIKGDDIKGVDDIGRGMTNDDLAHQLWKCLSRQTYLIVLDDIWDVSAWNEVKSSFPNDENGSRVMFTTRSLEVAKKCGISCSPHQLRFLNEVESWEILQTKVFRNDISPPYLYEVGKEIAKNCKGLSLAVVVIGGLLARTEKSLSWWSKVAQRLSYYLSDEGCMEILELSYRHLPKNLKPCLIYLGAFPEDSVISVKRVIMLWIAEGFVQESKTKSLEKVGQEYFYDLVDRSFIIVDETSCSGEIKTFRVHDLIRELCQTKCRDGNFFQLNHGSASSSSSTEEASINNYYRVSTKNKRDVTNADHGSSSLSIARTLHIFGNNDFRMIRVFPSRKLGLVQVLHLGTLNWVGNDINELTSLIHLRYIDACLQKIPDSIPQLISNLWNLTSLTLRLYTTMQFTETFWRLKSLTHVKVNSCSLKFPDDDKHESYLFSDQILDKVVSFSKPVLSTGKDVKRLLQRLPAVRKLSCCLKEPRVYDEESIETIDVDSVPLESLKLLQSLNLLDSIKPRQYVINFPSTLKKLTLGWFLLPLTTLSAIAQLHCLEVLKLINGSFVGQRLETEDLIFKNLIFFQLIDESLLEWNASTESFPCLEQLEIECQQLNELPPCFGEMSTLKRIHVTDSSQEANNSARRIQEEVMELGIQLELSILDTQ